MQLQYGPSQTMRHIHCNGSPIAIAMVVLSMSKIHLTSVPKHYFPDWALLHIDPGA